METIRFIRKKLFTKEDSTYIHKTFGIVSLFHYVYRIYEWITTTKINFTKNEITLFMIIIHMLLSFSSLVFHIPNIRNKTAPMIWPEFRLHSILFASRSLLVMLLHFYSFAHIHIRFMVHVFTMIGADLATLYYPPQGSTMRVMPYTYDNYWWLHKLFYSMCQVYATLEIITRENMDYAFMVLFPIQLSAFFMTLVRKGIITSNMWHILYTVSLLTTMSYCITSYSYVFDSHSGILYQLSAIIFMVGRFYFNINKYILWLIIYYVYTSEWSKAYTGICY